MKRFNPLSQTPQPSTSEPAKPPRPTVGRVTPCAPSGGLAASLIETTHTKKGHPLFVVQLADRVERAEYERLNAQCRELDGYYSSFRGHGAVPGFTFKARTNAEQFMACLKPATPVPVTLPSNDPDATHFKAVADRVAAIGMANPEPMPETFVANELKFISRPQWEALWSALDSARKTMPLMEFSEHCNLTKRRWSITWPGVDWSNGRYVVYIESLLAKGVPVPERIIASLKKEDIQFDWQAFPQLAPQLGYAAHRPTPQIAPLPGFTPLGMLPAPSSIVHVDFATEANATIPIGTPTPPSPLLPKERRGAGGEVRFPPAWRARFNR